MGETCQTIFENLSLDIYKGDFTVIMGASGAGKSTLMYSLSGMDRPTKGSIFFLTKRLRSTMMISWLYSEEKIVVSFFNRYIYWKNEFNG